MGKNGVILKSLLSAAGVLLYTSGVAWLLFNGRNLFGKAENFVAPLFILLLLVISATITGALVLGRPVMLYLDGRKKDALVSLFATIGWLIVFAVIIVVTLLI